MEEENLKEDDVQIQKNEQNPLLVPFAIIIAGVIIAGAVVYGFGNKKLFEVVDDFAKEQNVNNANVQQNINPSILNITPVSPKDHIRGNPNAPIKIVEYVDLECPYCKRFHFVMQQIISTYADKVAWVFRHNPIPQLHSKAFLEAVSSECAFEQGGDDIFWKYVDEIFKITPSNNNLDLSKLEVIAKNLNLDVEKFNSCISSGRYEQKVKSDIEDALKTGPQATPYSVVIFNGTPVESIEGAYDFNSVKAILDSLLQR
jgi:protein-disulfide isomerase